MESELVKLKRFTDTLLEISDYLGVNHELCTDIMFIHSELSTKAITLMTKTESIHKD